MTESIDDHCSLLFLSCDLTGSTHFKQAQAEEKRRMARSGATEETVPWQAVFLSFYRSFPQHLKSVQDSLYPDSKLRYDLWKPVGDELIYSALVESESDINEAVRTWIKAMDRFEEEELKTKGQLGTKGGAFIATFPGPDSRSSIPRDPESETSDADPVQLNREAYEGANRDHSKYLYDYFGPSIDTGFRILNQCSSRYFTLSVEAALGVILASDSTESETIVFHKQAQLKGVWDGREYPIIAIDRESEDSVNKAFRKMNGNFSPIDIRDLCVQCIKSDSWPSKLYLPNAKNTKIDDVDLEWDSVPPDPLDGYLSQDMSGAETEVPDEGNGNDLADNAPLGDSR